MKNLKVTDSDLDIIMEATKEYSVHLRTRVDGTLVSEKDLDTFSEGRQKRYWATRDVLFAATQVRYR
jgi:hypothetical protein